MRARRGQRRSIVAVVALPLLTSLLLSGCADLDELQFTQDDRLEFTSPGFNDLVETPVEVTWTMDDFAVVPKGSSPEPRDNEGLYAVFVDLAPVGPGDSLDDVADGDVACDADLGCPDRRYLAARGVYVTRKPSITLTTVTPLGSREDVQTHQVTVVLIDTAGDRIGESAWFTQFKMKNLLAAP